MEFTKQELWLIKTALEKKIFDFRRKDWFDEAEKAERLAVRVSDALRDIEAAQHYEKL